jgi:putative transcriptional regulator
MTKILKKPSKGNLLVARPYLGDPHFEQTVVLLTTHNEDGTVGFVINKSLEVAFDDVVLNFPKFNSTIYHGGPVQEDNLFFIHRKGTLIPNSYHVAGDLYWGGDLEPLKELIEMKLIQPQDIRFFLGYSGWTLGQLDDELEVNSWVILEADAVSVLDDSPTQLWKKIMNLIGGDLALFANGPEDPMLN